MLYDEKERLEIKRLIGVTDKVYKILREQKKRQGISMAKIICNLVLEKYDERAAH